MAPRTKQVANKKRPRSSIWGASNQQGEQAMLEVDQFFDANARTRFEYYNVPSNRIKFVTCSYISEVYVDALHIEEIMEKFRGLDVFLHCDDSINHNMLIEFYANLRRNGNNCLMSRVGRKNVEISNKDINDIFGWNVEEGTLTFNPFNDEKKWPAELLIGGKDLKSLAELYWNKKDFCWDMDPKEFKPRELEPLSRVVYEIIWAVLCPNSGSSSEATISQILLLYCLMEGVFVDFGAFMIQYMSKNCIDTMKKHLPFGNFLMRCLREKGIPEPPSSLTYEIVELKESFFDYKKLIYSSELKAWVYKEKKRVKKDKGIGGSKGGGSQGGGSQGGGSQGGGSQGGGSHGGAYSLSDMQASIFRTEERVKGMELEAKEEYRRNEIFRAQVRDEFDVLREAVMMNMTLEEGARLRNCRKAFETSRVALFGESAKNYRDDETPGGEEPRRSTSDGSSSSATP